MKHANDSVQHEMLVDEQPGALIDADIFMGKTVFYSTTEPMSHPQMTAVLMSLRPVMGNVRLFLHQCFFMLLQITCIECHC